MTFTLLDQQPQCRAIQQRQVFAALPEMSNYRKDVDGLRAVAVSLVLVFHLFPGKFPGGYIGVDVFFVISGYLISSLVHAESDAQSFSLLGFYERRARRILPALLAMMAVVLAIGVVILLPPELNKLAASAASATLFSANFYFASQAGYFGLAPTEQPLLHTWSLGVEEQFYLVFPLLAMMLSTLGRTTRAFSYGLLLVLSCAAAEFSVHRDPGLAFYMPFARAWELLAGALLSQIKVAPPRSFVVNSFLATAGVAMIAASALSYSRASGFPGFAALWPVAGVTLLIWSGQSDSVVRRALSHRLLRFLGLISFSLYLWHWPIIAFFENEIVRSSAFYVDTLAKIPIQFEKVLIAAISIAFAVLSWHLIETPFRNSKRFSRPMVFFLAGGAMVIELMAFSFVIVSNGLPFRFDAESVRIAAYLDYPNQQEEREAHWEGAGPLGRNCETEHGKDHVSLVVCRSSDPHRPAALLLGDSHAHHLSQTLRASIHGELLEVSASACNLYRGVEQIDHKYCRKAKNLISDLRFFGRPINVIVLARDWGTDDLPSLRYTIRRLHSVAPQIILVGPVPHYRVRLPSAIVASQYLHDVNVIADAVDTGSFELDRTMRLFAVSEGVHYFSAIDALCPLAATRRTCDVLTPDGVPVQFDNAHLTTEGSLLVTGPLARQVDVLLAHGAATFSWDNCIKPAC